MVDEARYERLPFPEAVDYLRSKIALPTDRWDDITDSQHDAAFVVAGVKGALLTDIKKLVERALEDGKTLEDFKADFDRLTTVQGWKPKQGIAFRQEIIYRTNLRMAHAAGRYAQQLDPEVLKIQPYLKYIHSDSTSPRPAHLALDGLVFRALDLPFWPPSGYGCSCRTISLTQRQLDEQGLEVSDLKRGDLADYKDERGQTRQAKLEPAPGFDYIPSQPSAERRQAIIAQIIARSPEPLASQMLDEAAKIDAAFGNLS